VDLGRAALRKIELNAIKYPVGKRHSTSSKKFARCPGNDDGNNDVGNGGGDKTVVPNEDDA
ncbi:hypothetical protein G0P98_28320, partial [Yangia sp. PrR004]|nr:hypothetical protein [Salipiger sp. PrR004]